MLTKQEYEQLKRAILCMDTVILNEKHVVGKGNVLFILKAFVDETEQGEV